MQSVRHRALAGLGLAVAISLGAVVMTNLEPGIIVGAENAASAVTKPKTYAHTLFGKAFDRDPQSKIVKAVRATKSVSQRKALYAISDNPVGTWFGDWDVDVTKSVAARVKAADSRKKIATLVMYNIPYRDCGDYSANAVTTATAYKTWVNKFVAGLGKSKQIVVIEPDASSLTDCLTPAQTTQRYALIKYAVQKLKAQGSFSYIDAGHTGWRPTEEMAKRLKASGIADATGFAMNVSNFQSTTVTTTYGTQLSRLVGGKHFVLDTSRNGTGGKGNEWCNPRGVALGTAPTSTTLSPVVDAYLWVKSPGESDGECYGDPGPGDWFANYALMLVRNAK